jgi:hypothetical protein
MVAQELAEPDLRIDELRPDQHGGQVAVKSVEA